MEAQTTGFLALGFGTTSLTNVDLIWGSVNSSGVGSINDYWSTSASSQVADTSDGGSSNVTLTDSSESGGKTSLTFRRALNTGDSKDTVISMGDNPIVWAIAKSGAADPEALDLNGNINSATLKVQKLSWLTATFGSVEVKWNIDDSLQEIEMQMIGDTTGYLSFGFGSSMGAADVYVGSYTTQANCSDAWSSAYQAPPADASNDISGVYGDQNNGKTHIGFFRALNTGDDKDIAITRNPMSIIWAVSGSDSDTVENHGKSNRGIGSINFYTGESSETDEGLSARDKHGIYMTISWGLIPVLLRWSFVYCAFVKPWVWVHLLLAILVGVLHYIGVQEVHSAPEGEETSDVKLHKTLASLVFFLAIWQFATGFLAMYAMKWSKIRIPYAFSSHGIPVYALIIVGFATIIAGFKVEWEDYIYIFILWLVFVVIVEAVLYSYTKVLQPKKGYVPLTPKGKVLSQVYSTFAEYKTEVANLTKKRYILMDNFVLDITDYVTSHPGGAFIFQDLALHDDISRFIVGNYALNQKVSVHVHSIASQKYIHNNLICGLLTVANKNVKSKSSDIEIETPSTEKPGKETWELTEKQNLTSDTLQCYFKSNTIDIDPTPNNLESMGRHFKVTATVNGKRVTRLYTTVFSLHHTRTRQRNELTAKASIQLDEEFLKKEENVGPHEGANELNLVLKVYGKTAKLTPFLAQYGPNGRSNFDIEGPCGFGLCLDSGSSGDHVIFGAGTGMFPFLDLFDYILRDLVEWNETGEKSAFLTNFKLSVYASYASRSHCVGLTLMEKCQKVAALKNYEGLNLNLFFRDQKKQNFDDSFITERKNVMLSAQKIYICGPPRFNDEIPRVLRSLGITHDKFFFI
eukprot:CAMPEP_0115008406 /NCGR_PEP_ID=MMETSP0216-20121206/21901_1 /TAXON_ID=223996 /ORGANISM="Protocruzia adherens, Strain Boccale" /LENGTH=859 /DNA_ID=CAMNT_0002375823 /DNA_START=310 /DNA_END=2889 /DNA_ORIENTATION=+